MDDAQGPPDRQRVGSGLRQDASRLRQATSRLRPAASRLRAASARLRPDLAPFRRSRQFRLLYAGQAAGTVSAMICYVAVPYQAYQLSRSSLVVGLVSAAELVPVLVAGLVGGVLADAVERRALILATQAAATAAMAALAVNALLWHRLWVLFLAGGLLAGAFGLQRPSAETIVPALIARGDLHAASALASLIGTAAQVGGPLLAGLLLTGGESLAYLFAAVVCAMGVLPFARMSSSRPDGDGRGPSLRGPAAGVRYARSRPDLLGTYLIDLGAMLFGAPYAVFPQVAAGLGGPAVLGLLYAAPGLGAVTVSLSSSWTRHVHRHGRAIALAVCGWGIAVTAFGLAPELTLAVLALAVAGAADTVSGLFRMTMWNQSIPAGVRGRLAGLEMISYSTGEPLGNVETGAVASVTGSVRLAVITGGLASLLGAGIVCLALPALWRYDARAVPGAPDQRPAGPGETAVARSA
ncbi:MAG: MFS transporter [Streptosporangiaceae bacterium]